MIQASHLMKKLTTVLLILLAFPALAQETMSPLQQYLYNESGYAPPQLAPAPVQAPETVAVAAPYYAAPSYPTPPDDTSPVGYYEDEGSDVGPSGDGGDTSLRGLLTSSGF